MPVDYLKNAINGSCDFFYMKFVRLSLIAGIVCTYPQTMAFQTILNVGFATPSPPPPPPPSTT